MGIARSTYYDKPKGSADDTALVEAMHAIKDEFEAYGWRRMQAALRHRGWVVNHKKIKRLMREHALHPPRRRRFVATTDSDHDEPVFPDRSRDREVDGPNQLWVADLTYIAILGGFVYLAAIMDAWSRRIVGYAGHLHLNEIADARAGLLAALFPEADVTRHNAEVSTAERFCAGAAAQHCTTGSAVACPRSPWEGPARGTTRPPRGWRRPARGRGLWAHGVKRGSATILRGFCVRSGSA